jgi:hypothetical protein
MMETSNNRPLNHQNKIEITILSERGSCEYDAYIENKGDILLIAAGKAFTINAKAKMHLEFNSSSKIESISILHNGK